MQARQAGSRLGPRPLPLHLGTALMTWASSESAWTLSKHASPNSSAAAVPDAVAALLPDLEVRSGGSTSVDITRKGIDKAYGTTRLMEILGVGTDEILFFGDRLDEGGNDRPVQDLGIDSVHVRGFADTYQRLSAIVG